MNVPMNRTCLTIAVTAALAVAMIGCGEDRDVQLQRARIAMDSSSFDQALEIADDMLADDPHSRDALEIKARAQLRLQQFDNCRRTIDDWLAINPDDTNAHRLFTDWALHMLNHLLNQSDLPTDTAMQKVYGDTLAAAKQHIDWLASHGDPAANTTYLRARFTHADALRYDVAAQQKASSISNIYLDDSDRLTDQTSDHVAGLRSAADERFYAALDLLDEVVSIDATHFDAIDMQLRLLAERGQWQRLNDFAAFVAGRPQLPAYVTERLVTVLLKVPNAEMPRKQRVALGREAMQRVSDEGRDSAEWKLSGARLFLLDGQAADAQPLIDDVLDDDPHNIDARFLMAQCLFYQQHWDKALALLKPLSTEAAGSPGVQLFYGMTLARSGDTLMAKEALRRAVELDPEDPSAREAFLNLMASLGQIEAAEDDIDTYLRQNPAGADAINFKLRYEMMRGRRNEVEKLTAHIAALETQTPEHLLLLIDGLLYLDQHEAAREAAVRLVALDPDSVDAKLRLAETKLLMGETDSVQAIVDELSVAEPEHMGVTIMRARLAMSRSAYDDASRDLEQIVAEEPAQIESRMLLARCFTAMNRTDDALRHVQVVIERDPNNINAHALAARIYQYLGDTRSADEHLAHIDETTIDSREHASLLAQIKLRQGKVIEAVSIAEHAIETGNTDPLMRLILAAFHARRGDLDKAEAQLVAMARATPDSAMSFQLLAKFYVEHDQTARGLRQLAELEQLNQPMARLAQATLLASSGQFDLAIDRLVPVFEPLLAQRDARAMLVADALGKLYDRTAQYDKPFAVYQAMIDAGLDAQLARLRQIDLRRNADGAQVTAKRLDEFAATLGADQQPMRAEAIKRMILLGELATAERWIDQWIEAEPQRMALYLWKGNLLIESDRARDAAAIFRHALEIEPQNVIAHQRLAQAYEAAYDYPAAERAWRQMSELPGSSRTVGLTQLGRMFLRLGLKKQASDTFAQLDRHAIERDPQLNLAMGRALASIGDVDQARHRLGSIGESSSRYAEAQIELTRIDRELGRTDQAMRRMQLLATNDKLSVPAVRRLVDMNPDEPANIDMLRWALQDVRIDAIEDTQVRQAWLAVRLIVEAADHDWPATADTLEQLAMTEPASANLATARIVVLTALQRHDEAQRVYKVTASLHESPLGGALGTFLGLSANVHPNQEPLLTYFQSLAAGRPDVAMRAASAVSSTRTVFFSDLKAYLGRPEARTQQGAMAARLTLGALLAIKAGVKPLGVEYCRQAMALVPDMMPAQAVWVGALIESKQSIDAAAEFAEQTTSGTSGSALGLFLKAHQLDKAGEHAQAALILEQLSRIEANNAHVRYLLVQQYKHSDQTDRAIALLEQLAAQPGPLQYMAANDAAYLIAEHQPQRIEQAYDIAKRTLANTPQSLPLLDTIGWIEHRRGRHEPAMEYLGRVAEGLGSLPEVQYHLGAVYRAMGNDVWAGYYLQAAAQGPADLPEVSKARQLLGETDRVSAVSF